MKPKTITDPIDVEDEGPDPLPAPDVADALALRKPTTPITIGELALTATSNEIIRRRAEMVSTARAASIRITSPPDWLAFKTPDDLGGQVTCYLSDAGCQRVRPLWGISIFNVSVPERIDGDEPGDFYYVILGDGACELTHTTTERVEGGRGSREEFCKGVTGAQLVKLVRRAARANLNGSILRELAGLGAVPIEELIDAWKGTSKSIEQVRRGRGFGSKDQRLGGVEALDAGIDPPPCPVCKKPMVLRKGTRGNFYSCIDYKAHGRDARTVDADRWIAEHRAKRAPTPAGPPANGALDADEIFGREPGQEG